MIDKIKNFFFEADSEKETLEKELKEETKKYEKKRETESKIVLNPVEKQVLFVDEEFENTQPIQKPQDNTKKSEVYNDVTENKFRPTKFISPIHGLLKEPEEAKKVELGSKTIAESDYAKIRNKAFPGDSDDIQEVNDDDVKVVSDHTNSKHFKIFKTSEIVDLKSRIQVENDSSIDANMSIDEAYDKSENNEVFDSNTLKEKVEDTQDLFDLLDELGEVDGSSK